MTKEIENLIKKIALRDVKLKMLNASEHGILTASVLENILQELEEEYS